MKTFLLDGIPPVRVVPFLLNYKDEAFLNREHNYHLTQKNSFILYWVYSHILGVLNVLGYSLVNGISKSCISIENSFGQRVYLHIVHILLMLLSFSILFFLTMKKKKWFEMTPWQENQVLKRNRREARSLLISFDPVWLSFTHTTASCPGVLFRFSTWMSLNYSFVNSEACKWWKDYIFSRSNLRQFAEFKKMCSIACSKIREIESADVWRRGEDMCQKFV